MAEEPKPVVEEKAEEEPEPEEEPEAEPSQEISLDLGGPSRPVATGNRGGEVEMTVEAAEPEPAVPLEPAAAPHADDPEFQVETHEEEEYQGPELEPYNPRLDLENYHSPRWT